MAHLGVDGAVLLPLILAGGWIHWGLWRYQQLVPPPETYTIRQFASHFPPPRRLKIGQAYGGETVVIWSAEKIDCLASGPAQYAFDEKGRFVAWTPDCGDVPFKPMLRVRLRTLQPITLEEAMLLCGARGEPGMGTCDRTVEEGA